jgi:chromosomal replication initiator protein
VDNKKNMDNEIIWQKIFDILKNEVQQETFDLWIKPIKPKEMIENVFILQVPNKFYVEWLKKNQKMNIEKLLQEITGKQLEVDFTIEQDIDTITKGTQLEPLPPLPEQEFETHIESEFNPKYTFDTFVIGTTNKFAASACKAAANNPGKEYNPIFIYGGVGLGKTHLLHATGNEMVQRNPKLKVLYIPSEKFINEFIDSLKYGTPASFKNKFRTLDCLLIDDIQFLIDKERSQEEFFYTFNTLFDSNKQIIITSDRHPKDLSNIQERLISRFEWGIVADIKPPDYETRVAILRKKSESEKVFVPDDVINFLAEKTKTNIRELEGTFIRVVAFSSLTGTPLTIDNVKEILEDVIQRQESSEPILIEKIQEVVAKHFHIDLKDMKSKKRTDDVALPRQIAMYLARTLTKQSTIEIGEAFGGKDHTTVIHAYNKIKNKIKTDIFFNTEINKIIKKIKQSET